VSFIYFFFVLKIFDIATVPQTYPMDEDLIKLCMINQLQRLGLAEHFAKEIDDSLGKIYRYSKESYMNVEIIAKC